jgi:hypothetical protein
VAPVSRTSVLCGSCEQRGSREQQGAEDDIGGECAWELDNCEAKLATETVRTAVRRLWDDIDDKCSA